MTRADGGSTDSRRCPGYAQYPSVLRLVDRGVTFRCTRTDDTIWPFELDNPGHNCDCVNARPA